MSFRLVDSGWDKHIREAVNLHHSELRIVSPFIKHKAAERLLAAGTSSRFQVITRFNLDDLHAKVSDLSALRLLLDHGAQIRGIKNLHSKLYLFGGRRVIVTSANLTQAALHRNLEFGFVADDPTIVRRCRDYFDDLWQAGGLDLTEEQVLRWESKLLIIRPSARRRTLGDEGADAGFSPFAAYGLPAAPSATQSFVKFFGADDNRADCSAKVLDIVGATGAHWACTYPKRPWIVEDGAVMFVSRLTRDPNDVLIFGRAIARSHDAERDVATRADKSLRPWKKQWPYYIRVHDPEFVDGTLDNGVSLNQLMERLGTRAFASTLANSQKQAGNTDPRKAYRRHAQVRLSAEGLAWMHYQLESAFAEHGKLSPAKLKKLDWPTARS